jgi:hypothetical protein
VCVGGGRGSYLPQVQQLCLRVLRAMYEEPDPPHSVSVVQFTHLLARLPCATTVQLHLPLDPAGWGDHLQRQILPPLPPPALPGDGDGSRRGDPDGGKVAGCPPFFPLSGDQAERNSVDMVVPGLYLTNFRGARDLPRLRELGVTRVLPVSGDADDGERLAGLTYFPTIVVQDEEDQSAVLGAHLEEAAAFIHLCVQQVTFSPARGGLDPSPPSSPPLPLPTGGATQAAIPVDATAGSALSSATPHAPTRPSGVGGVVVHCAAGISRSATVVLYYLMYVTSRLPLFDICA